MKQLKYHFIYLRNKSLQELAMTDILSTENYQLPILVFSKPTRPSLDFSINFHRKSFILGKAEP